MKLLDEAKALQETLVKHRRYFHQNAEVHDELPLTTAYVMERLKEMGYEPVEIVKSGVVAVAGKKAGKTFLLRADMDALPIAEQSGVPFSSQTENMHACGHDLHTAMLLGAARLLKDHEDELNGQVKLMFQPAEETLFGANEMIKAGLLENPRVDAALMLHVLAASDVATGCVVVPPDGVCSAAADWFTIRVQGKGGHGATPHKGVDPLNVIAHIYLALQEINAREVPPDESVAITVGQVHGGETSNVIPDTAMMSGTIRTFSEQTRGFVKQRVEEIVRGVAATFRATATVEYSFGCPCVVVDKALIESVAGYCAELLGADKLVDLLTATGSTKMLGSEDFAYVCELVPGSRLSIPAGTISDGHIYPGHHPKITFDEDALPVGAAVYAHTAMAWLRDNG
jgi:amidohydrolase